MSSNTETAQEIVDLCNRYGWEISFNDPQQRILTITKRIPIHDLDAFAKADGEYPIIFSALPRTRPGSIWGTDGGGVGAQTALRTGLMTMKCSGGSIRVLNALRKLING